MKSITRWLAACVLVAGLWACGDGTNDPSYGNTDTEQGPTETANPYN